MSGQLHALAALLPVKESVFIAEVIIFAITGCNITLRKLLDPWKEAQEKDGNF
jgi:hypothetical protein